MSEQVSTPDDARWWETTPAGSVIPLAFVKIDRVGSTREWSELAPEDVDKRHARYTAGVEAVARSMHAAQPLNWQGDGVMFFLTDDEAASAPVRGFRAAKLLWERLTVDLGLAARIAVHAAHVSWTTDTGKLRHSAIDRCGHLEHDAPESAIAVSDDVYLALPEPERRAFAPLGVTTRDGTPAWVFPGNAAERKRADAFRDTSDLVLWERFRAYVRSAEIRKLRYVGFPLAKKEPPALDIEDVFVPLEVRARRRPLTPLQEGDPKFRKRNADERPSSDDPEIGAAPFGILEAEEQPGQPEPFGATLREARAIVVLGDPGSGKTTLLRWLAAVSADGPFATSRDLGVAERLLPLPISIGAVADVRRELGVACSVPDAFARYFHGRNVGEEAELREFLVRALESGQCLVLLDGLDEVRAAERDELRAWLETFAGRYERNRFVVSSRHVGFAGFALSDGVVTVLEPFTEAQVRRYVEGFTRAYRRWELRWPDALAEAREAAQLMEAIDRNPRLAALARNPFMLSALALINRAEGRLPRHRVQCYAIFARALCETWGHARRIVAREPERVVAFEEEAIPILGELALAMFEAYPTGVAPEDFVLGTLTRALAQRRGVPPSEADAVAREFLKRAGDETQILLDRGAGRWGFLHLTFQEFFAAAGLHAAERFEEEALRHLLDPRWEEVLRLGVGYQALIQNRPEAARRFVERVLNHREKGIRAPLNILPRKHEALAALLAAEAGDALPRDLQRDVAAKFSRWALDMPDDLRTRALAEIGFSEVGERVGSFLVEALRNNGEPVRGSAILALGTLRVGAAAPTLMEFLRHENPFVRADAAVALGILGTQEAVPALVQMLGDADAWVRAHVAGALVALRAEGALPSLLELVGENGIQGHYAAEALGTFQGQATVSMLVQSLKDQRGWVRARVALALGRLRAFEAVPALTDLLKDRDTWVRVDAARALAELGAPNGISALVELLNDGDAWARGRAAVALGVLRPEGVVPVLLRALKDDDWRVRARTAAALGTLRAEEAVSALTELLRDGDARVRRSATDALGALQAEEAIPSLLEALEDQDRRVRLNAAVALAPVRADVAVPVLVGELQQEDLFAMARAAKALATVRTDAAARALRDSLKSEDQSVRAFAAAELAALGAKEAVPTLIAALKSKYVVVRERAAEVLGALQIEAAIKPLVELASEDSPQRDAAIRALMRIAESRSAPARRRARRPPVRLAKPQRRRRSRSGH